MKKLLSILLALALALTLAACGQPTGAPAETPAAPAEPELEAEPEAELTSVTWYGTEQGIDMTLTLTSDGTYAMELGGEVKSGVWTEDGGEITLDDDGAPTFLDLGDSLYWLGMETYLTDEEDVFGVYRPADVLTEGVTASDYNGYWKSLYVETDGAIFAADELDDRTDVYIEAPRAALGGPLFGDVMVELTRADSALSWSEGDISVTLALQEDGLLRLTLADADGDMILYLMPVYVDALDDTEAPAEGG